MNRIFLDNNATTQPTSEVVEAISSVLTSNWGNPSSLSQSGEEARSLILRAREQVASLAGCTGNQVVFTSGGTEANNLGVLAMVEGSLKGKFLTSSIEHASILEMRHVVESKGIEFVEVRADRSGQIDLGQLRDLLRKGDVVGASFQWVNNETGAIQPVIKIGEECQEAGIPLHCDASQAYGKLPIRFDSAPIDYLSVTAHKIHGPKGVGALISKRPLPSLMIQGGGQEFGSRPGTENITGIVGFGKAAWKRKAEFDESILKLETLRVAFEKEICKRVPEVRINALESDRICNTSNLQFPGIEGPALLHRLDLKGIECSQSSACTSGRPEPSHVLTAMGLSEDEAYESLRFSFSVFNTKDELQTAVEVIANEYLELRRKQAALTF